LRLGLVLGAAGLVVRNPVRTYRIDWADVTGFTDGGTVVQSGDPFGVIEKGEPRWALKINASQRGPVTAWGLRSNRETRSLLARLGAAHGVPVNITGLPNGGDAEVAHQIEEILIASPNGLTRNELVERIGGQVSAKAVDRTLTAMKFAERVARVTDLATGKRIVRWTSAPPAEPITPRNLGDAT
jgi:hypothetical protein